MNSTMEFQKGMRFEDQSLYSKRGIAIASIIGTPIASSYLIKHNFDRLGEEDNGRTAMIFGISFTVSLFVLLYSIPDSIISKIPSQILPLLYTLLTNFLVEKYQGEKLKQYENSELSYITKWKAAGIGLVGGIISILMIIPIVFLDPNLKGYENGVETFAKNEAEALEIFNSMNSENPLSLIPKINNKSIPLWEENRLLIDSLTSNLKLDKDMKNHFVKLTKYSELRLEELSFIKRAIIGNTFIYDYKIDSLRAEIQNVFDSTE